MANDISAILKSIVNDLMGIVMEHGSVRDELKHLNSTNLPLTIAQRVLLRQMNHRRQALIEHYESQSLGRIGFTGELLKEAIDLLESWKEDYNTPLSLVREIPVELLGYIFELVISEALRKNETHMHHGGFPTLSSLLYLSQVCSRWRSICHCTPKLWTVLPQCFNKPIATPDLDAELAFLWCQRAAPYPVDLSLQGREHTIPIPLLPTLTQCAGSIGTLRLYASDTEFLSLPQNTSMSMTFPVLEYLSLTVNSHYSPDYESNPDGRLVRMDFRPPVESSFDQILPLIERLHAPQLSRLELRLKHTVPDIRLYGGQLRELELCLVSPSNHSEPGDTTLPSRNIFAGLRHCTRLVSLKLQIDFRGRIDGHDGHLVLDELELFQVDFGYEFDGDDIMEVFSILTLPKLKELYTWFPDDFTWNAQVMRSFKDRSDFSLRRLALGNCGDDVSPDDLWEFIGSMDTLEELSVGRYVHGLELLPYLLPRTGTQYCPLPILRVLEVLIWTFGDGPTPETDGLVERLVKSRWWTDPAQRSYHRWARVHIAKDGIMESAYPEVDMDMISPEAEQRMAVIASEGLSLDFDGRYNTIWLV
ncbi:hypothetical protein PM082_013380 [Marasmius tenuissimus]|nr:hypothetical protein PM082_013380 [Marasmius tenuissimus]